MKTIIDIIEIVYQPKPIRYNENPSINYGSLTLGDDLMVTSERIFTAAERKNACWYRTNVRVEPCTHPGYTAETCPYHVHE